MLRFSLGIIKIDNIKLKVLNFVDKTEVVFMNLERNIDLLDVEKNILSYQIKEKKVDLTREIYI